MCKPTNVLGQLPNIFFNQLTYRRNNIRACTFNQRVVQLINIYDEPMNHLSHSNNCLRNLLTKLGMYRRAVHSVNALRTFDVIVQPVNVARTQSRSRTNSQSVDVLKNQSTQSPNLLAQRIDLWPSKRFTQAINQLTLSMNVLLKLLT